MDKLAFSQSKSWLTVQVFIYLETFTRIASQECLLVLQVLIVKITTVLTELYIQKSHNSPLHSDRRNSSRRACIGCDWRRHSWKRDTVSPSMMLLSPPRGARRTSAHVLGKDETAWCYPCSDREWTATETGNHKTFRLHVISSQPCTYTTNSENSCYCQDT